MLGQDCVVNAHSTHADGEVAQSIIRKQRRLWCAPSAGASISGQFHRRRDTEDVVALDHEHSAESGDSSGTVSTLPLVAMRELSKQRRLENSSARAPPAYGERQTGTPAVSL